MAKGSDMDRELLRYVLDELEYYQTQWRHDMQDSSVRRGSSSLRSLLIENKLQLAWKEVGFSKQMRVMAPSLDEIIAGRDSKEIQFAQAGGGLSHAIQIAGPMVLNRALSPDEIKAEYNKGPGSIHKVLWLAEYLDSACMIVQGVRITRKEVIQYVSNKLGGAHYDPERDASKKLEEKYSLLDKFPQNHESWRKRSSTF